MQPYVFPYIGYFQLIHAAGRFVVYDDVAFIKQGWISRNRILIHGQPSFFTIPVRHASSFVSIRDTLIDDGPQNRRWAEKLLRTFDNAYRRAPEYARIIPVIEGVLRQPATRVAEVALASVKAVAAYLDIRVEWVDTSAALAPELKGEERVIGICKELGATEYINAAGGRELYSADRFEKEHLRLRFLQPHPLEYPQFGAPFVPWLSIVDVLMFNPREIVLSYLNRYDLT